MKQMIYKKTEPKKSKTVLILMVIWSKIKLLLLQLIMFLLSILAVSGLLIRTAIYSLIVIYVIIPLSPWPDFQINFINLWIIMFAIVGIVRAELSFKEPAKPLGQLLEQNKYN